MRVLRLGFCGGWRCWGERTGSRVSPSYLYPVPKACGPTLHQICKENTYVNGFCFLFGPNLLQQPQRLPKTLRGRLCLGESTERQPETRWLGAGLGWGLLMVWGRDLEV